MSYCCDELIALFIFNDFISMYKQFNSICLFNPRLKEEPTTFSIEEFSSVQLMASLNVFY